jgi:hypothetical protein
VQINIGQDEPPWVELPREHPCAGAGTAADLEDIRSRTKRHHRAKPPDYERLHGLTQRAVHEPALESAEFHPSHPAQYIATRQAGVPPFDGVLVAG